MSAASAADTELTGGQRRQGQDLRPELPSACAHCPSPSAVVSGKRSQLTK